MAANTGISITIVAMLGGCSPYLYAPEITTLSGGVSSLRFSQQSIESSLMTARDQAITDGARPYGKAFIIPVECVSSGVSCVAVPRPDRPPSRPSADDRAAATLKAADPGVGVPPALSVPVLRGCPAPSTLKAAAPRPDVSLDVILSALEAYSKSLAAVTNAKDRAEFDTASTALAASSAALAGLMIGGPPGAGGAAVATLVIELARYGVAVSLDARRYRTLRCAVLHSQDAVGVLGIIAGAMLADRVVALRAAYVDDSNAITRNMSLPKPAGKWEDNVARQQSLATRIAALGAIDPVAAAKAMASANDALAKALEAESRQTGAVATVVADFASKAAAIQRAATAR